MHSVFTRSNTHTHTHIVGAEFHCCYRKRAKIEFKILYGTIFADRLSSFAHFECGTQWTVFLSLVRFVRCSDFNVYSMR